MAAGRRVERRDLTYIFDSSDQSSYIRSGKIIGFTFLEVTGFTMLSTPAPGVAAFRGIYAVSDIHTDYKQNLDWATSLSGYEDDVLLVAGDVSDDLVTFEATMEALSSSFWGRLLRAGQSRLVVSQG